MPTSFLATPPFAVFPPSPRTCRSTSKFCTLSIAISVLLSMTFLLARSCTPDTRLRTLGVGLAVLDPDLSTFAVGLQFQLPDSSIALSLSSIASAADLSTSFMAAPSRPRLTRSAEARPLWEMIEGEAR